MKDPLWSEQTPYEVLGVDPAADDRAVYTAFAKAIAQRVPPAKATAARNALQRPIDRGLLNIMHYPPGALAKLRPSPTEDLDALKPVRRAATASAWERQLRASFPDFDMIHGLGILWYQWCLYEEERLAAIRKSLHEAGYEVDAGASKQDLLRLARLSVKPRCFTGASQCPNPQCAWHEDCHSSAPPLDEMWSGAIAFWGVMASFGAAFAGNPYIQAPMVSELQSAFVTRVKNDFTRMRASSNGYAAPEAYAEFELALDRELEAAREVAAAGFRTAKGAIGCGPLMLRRVGFLDRARESLGELARRNPSNSRLQAVIGSLSQYRSISLLIDGHKPDAALADIDELPSEEQSSPEVQDLRRKALHEKAHQLASTGNVKLALGYWRQALAGVNTRTSPPGFLGKVRDNVVATCLDRAKALQYSRPDEAIEILELSARVVRDTQIEMTLAELLVNRGIQRFNKANAELEEKAGQSASLLPFLELDDAIADLERAGELGSSRAPLQLGQAKEVLEYAESGVLHMPRICRELLRQANEAAGQGNWYVSVSKLHEAIRNNGGQAPDQIWEMLGAALANRGIQRANTALTFFNANPSHQAAMTILEDLQEAHADLAEALNIDPSNAHARQNRDEIQKILGQLQQTPRTRTFGTRKKPMKLSGSLQEAVRSGKDRDIRVLVKKGEDVNKAQWRGSTPLKSAIEVKREDYVKYLIAKGARATEVLIDAVQDGDVQTLGMLLANGAKPDVSYATGESLLHVFAMFGRLGLARSFLEHGADPNVTDPYGRTPLHIAAAQCYAGLMALLVSKGADVNVRDALGNTPLHYVALQKDERSSKSRKDAESMARNLERLRDSAYPGAWIGIQCATWEDEDWREFVRSLRNSVYWPVDLAAAADLITQLAEKNRKLAKRRRHERTADERASRAPSTEVIPWLLEKGADPSIGNRHKSRPLHVAAGRGKVTVIEALVNHGADVNAKDSRARTALHLASEVGYVEVVDALLHKGAKTDMLDLEGATPLVRAARAGHHAVVQKLIAKGAQADVCNASGMTPLHVAAAKGDAHMVYVLGAGGAPIGGRDSQGYTPMQYAAHFKHDKVIDILRKLGVSLSASIHAAAAAGYADDVASFLKQGVPVDAKDPQGNTALCHAVSSNRQDMVEILLRHGADPASRTSQSRSMLHIAAEAGDGAIVGALLKAGAHVDPLTKSRKTPLHLASYHGCLDAARILLEHGADPNARADNGTTPLHVAAWADHGAVARLLLDKGGDPNAADHRGMTALHYAAIKADAELSEILLSAGARPDAVDVRGETPGRAALQNGNLKAVRAYEDRGHHVAANLSDAVRTGSLHAVQRFLDAGADANAPAGSGLAPLLLAVENGDSLVLKCLLDRGADVKVVDEQGNSALHRAALAGNHGAAELLIEAGLSVSAVNQEGRTPAQLVDKDAHSDLYALLSRKAGPKGWFARR